MKPHVTESQQQSENGRRSFYETSYRSKGGFRVQNEEHDILLSNDLRIELLQLPKWTTPQETQKELDRWFCLFREGAEADTDKLPDLLNSHEMKEAIEVLNQISESQREYLIYQQRLDALSLEATRQEERERLERETAEAKRGKAEAEREKAEAERGKADAERQKEDAEQREAEAKRLEKEAEQREAHERQEKERLLALLRQAGIDPS